MKKEREREKKENEKERVKGRREMRYTLCMRMTKFFPGGGGTRIWRQSFPLKTPPQKTQLYIQRIISISEVLLSVVPQCVDH